MKERILVTPPALLSPAVAEAIPLGQAVVEELRTSYAVDVFHWPTIKGGPRIEPTWQGMVEAFRVALTPGCHVVAQDGALPLLALDGRTDVASFVSLNILCNAPTLRSLGLPELAAMFEVVGQVTGSPETTHVWLGAMMEGAHEEQVRGIAEAINRDIDWPVWLAVRDSWSDLDMLEAPPTVTTPMLYFNQPAAIMAGGAELIRRLAPNAVIEQMEGGAIRIHEREQGREFARRAVAFMQQHSMSSA